MINFNAFLEKCCKFCNKEFMPRKDGATRDCCSIECQKKHHEMIAGNCNKDIEKKRKHDRKIKNPKLTLKGINTKNSSSGKKQK